MTALELLVDLHKSQERQGPGSKKDTIKALSFTNLSGKSGKAIADIGCGTGGQTLTLARHLEGHITAVDLFPQFLHPLQKQAKNLSLQNQITCLEASMDALPFEKEQFDLIWSEGAIYNVGFEYGIRTWKEFLKPGGYLAVSEITWISQNRPKAILDFWKQAYPEITTASNNIAKLENHGYTLAGYFYLQPDSWLKNYYEPLEASFESFLERHGHAALAVKVVNEHREEIELYKTYRDYYSYGFYVVRKEG